jgi:hypothetical protein
MLSQRLLKPGLTARLSLVVSWVSLKGVSDVVLREPHRIKELGAKASCACHARRRGESASRLRRRSCGTVAREVYAPLCIAVRHCVRFAAGPGAGLLVGRREAVWLGKAKKKEAAIVAVGGRPSSRDPPLPSLSSACPREGSRCLALQSQAAQSQRAVAPAVGGRAAA